VAPSFTDLGRILVVIPTYNEVENLARIVTRVRASVPEAHVLVADDNSVVDKATGNFALVYDAKVMNSLTESPGFLGVGPLPGSWNDLGTF